MSQGRGSARKRHAIKQRLSAEQKQCFLCLEPLDFEISDWRDPLFVVIDEYIPVSKGGDPLDIANCNLAHNRCNGRKGGRILPRGAFAKDRARAAGEKPKTSRKWL